LGEKAWVTLGEVTRVRGLAGELVVRPWSDKIARFASLKEVYLGREEPKAYKVVLARAHSGNMFLQLEGITTPEQASGWVKSLVQIPLQELPKLTEDEYYVHDMVGSQVYSEDQEFLGELKEVMTNPGNHVLLVRGEKKEYYIPATKKAVVSVDLLHKKIVVRKDLAIEQ
jgi:16S rRNA processing protein RimM